MLNTMGAKITGVGSNLLHIEGVKELKGCYHRILPDMIEIGSFIGLAAMTQSEITIKDVGYENLWNNTEVFVSNIFNGNFRLCHCCQSDKTSNHNHIMMN